MFLFRFIFYFGIISFVFMSFCWSLVKTFLISFIS